MLSEKEIDASVVVETDSDTVIADHVAGFVSTATASKIRGYAEGEAEKAAKDHEKRLAAIAAAQSSAATDITNRMGARGLPDADADPNSPAKEKAESRETDNQPTTADRTRGEGQ